MQRGGDNLTPTEEIELFGHGEIGERDSDAALAQGRSRGGPSHDLPGNRLQLDGNEA